MSRAGAEPDGGARAVELPGGLARKLALEAGFSDAGIAALPYSAEERDAARFAAWVAAGLHGTMGYLERRAEDGRLLRTKAAIPFPWARSVVVCWASCNTAGPLSMDAAPEGAGWIARYAWSGRRDAGGQQHPSDYHKVLKKRLEALEARLHAELGAFEARAFVDTGPVVERSLAVAAGLGWTGKNTCLIHPRLGSFGFLAVLLTSLKVAGEPAVLTPDRCGSCRRCLDACPTHALIAPYQMDARRCIAYLTIEHRGALAEELLPGMGRQVFGCDICQDVCPWNRKAPVSVDAELQPRAELVNPELEALAAMDAAEWERRFNGSPVRRAGFAGLRRNVAVAMGNSGLARFAPLLEQWLRDGDEGLRTAAAWALKTLSHARSNRGTEAKD